MKKYGLIGFPLTHSFSKKYFTEKFSQEEIEDVEYELFPLENIDDIRLLFEVEKSLSGLNVTIPYKEKIIEYLDDLDESAKIIGAVNCIKIEEIAKTGYNTDWLGFKDSIAPLLKTHHKKALILGTGGASKAVLYAFQKLGLESKFVSRNKKENQLIYEELDQSTMNEFQVIVNTTPLGMFPNIMNYPEIPYQFLSALHLCFDLVYNPEETMFLQKSNENHAVIKSGLEMLELQAEYAWKIWNEEEEL